MSVVGVPVQAAPPPPVRRQNFGAAFHDAVRSRPTVLVSGGAGGTVDDRGITMADRGSTPTPNGRFSRRSLIVGGAALGLAAGVGGATTAGATGRTTAKAASRRPKTP